jgi:hypothetical protein
LHFHRWDRPYKIHILQDSGRRSYFHKAFRTFYGSFRSKWTKTKTSFLVMPSKFLASLQRQLLLDCSLRIPLLF